MSCRNDQTSGPRLGSASIPTTRLSLRTATLPDPSGRRRQAERWSEKFRELPNGLLRPLIAASNRIGRWGLSLRGFESGRVETSVGPVHVLKARGRGHLPPVVVLHGLSVGAVSYAPLLVQLLPGTRQIIAPDLPAHGFSPIPAEPLNLNLALTSLIEALDVVLEEPSVLFGNSLGGWLSVLYALARPRNVRALVLSSPGGAASTPDEIENLRRLLQVDRFSDALELIDRMLSVPRWLRPVFAALVRAQLSHRTLREMIGGGKVEELLGAHQLAALPMPVLLLWGTEERLLPASHLQFFQAGLPPQAVVESLEAHGHCACITHPKIYAERILRFAADLSLPAVARPRAQAV